MILVSIGANLPGPDGAPPLETCRRAARALGQLQGLRLRALSRWYATAPVLPASVLPAGAPPTGEQPTGPQPDYVNAVAHLAAEPGATIDPAWLLHRLMALEAAAGRVRGERNAPRVLDLDIVAIDDLVRCTPDPVLPHPRAHERAFVLVPLAEVAPGWVHPLLGHSVETLIARLPAQDVRVL
jgi:2-amino-4-hydroxy-6-hydroxymethyldihydropteridine diphosphokinase